MFQGSFHSEKIFSLYIKCILCILLSNSNGFIMRDTLSFPCNVVPTIYYSLFHHFINTLPLYFFPSLSLVRWQGIFCYLFKFSLFFFTFFHSPPKKYFFPNVGQTIFFCKKRSSLLIHFFNHWLCFLCSKIGVKKSSFL
jgi:hypothetical protein